MRVPRGPVGKTGPTWPLLPGAPGLEASAGFYGSRRIQPGDASVLFQAGWIFIFKVMTPNT